jgi:hypothetical protein
LRIIKFHNNSFLGKTFNYINGIKPHIDMKNIKCAIELLNRIIK